MLDFTWKVFCMTGDIDTYLLFKEMEEQDLGSGSDADDEEFIDNQPTQ